MRKMVPNFVYKSSAIGMSALSYIMKSTINIKIALL